ncbi:MAG: Sec-independent protein translocase protein TatC [Planctomycetes bacterium ADurb.Bin126]|nr:MAG: Sec-independent protein translocase protein TatC [Planctomycetes bacterium ADurb.Bin126]HOD80325.1 twin-arginine translocase subunit TatC [Phycisphaerae bacterium]HQL72521.1 twin-arginine translocase subunit TatC [Phycisphaerae bacterium]
MTRPQDDNPHGQEGADDQAQPTGPSPAGDEPQMDVEGRVIQPQGDQADAPGQGPDDEQAPQEPTTPSTGPDQAADEHVPPGHEPGEYDEWIRRNDRMAIGEREGDYSAWAQQDQAEPAPPNEEQPADVQPQEQSEDQPQEQAEADDDRTAAPAGEAMDGVEAGDDLPPDQAGQVEETTEGQDAEYSYEEGYREGEYTDESYAYGEGGYGTGEGTDQQYDYTGESGYTGEGSQDESAAENAGEQESSALAAKPPSDVTTGDEDEDDDEEGGPKMTLGEHLEELRQRLIKALAGLAIAMVVTIATAKVMITSLLAWPYNQVQIARGHPEQKLMVIGATTGFTIFFKVALIAGIVLAAPWIFYQLWMFVAAGLYKNERRYVKATVPFSAALFIAGAMFYLFVAARPMLYFLFSFNDWMGIETNLTLDSHITLMSTMMLVFGLAFQMPLVVLILYKVGILSPETLKYYRRHVIVIILIVCAILTPPDPTAQLLLAVPMYLLYELGMLLVYLSERKRKRLEAAEEPKD